MLSKYWLNRVESEIDSGHLTLIQWLLYYPKAKACMARMGITTKQDGLISQLSTGHVCYLLKFHWKLILWGMILSLVKLQISPGGIHFQHN